MYKKPIIISFFTKNTPYEQEIQGLITSAKKFDLEVDIDGIDSQGSWEKNCCFKPRFIREKLENHKRPILWLDADAVLFKNPIECFSWTYDMATRINKELDINHPSKIITGTVFANYTPLANKMLTLWEKQCHEQLTKPHEDAIWDQICLKDALIKNDLLHFLSPIPLSYGAIIHHKDEIHDPVIVHYQASRTFKPLIDGTVNPAFFNDLQGMSSDELKSLRERQI